LSGGGLSGGLRRSGGGGGVEQYAVGDSLRGSGVADHHGGVENTRMNDYDGIRSTVPPHRVLQMIGEQRFYEVMRSHANDLTETM